MILLSVPAGEDRLNSPQARMFSGDSPLAGFADEWARPGKNLRTKSAIARRSWLRRRFVSLRTGTASTGQEFSGHRTTGGKDPQLCPYNRLAGECAYPS